MIPDGNWSWDYEKSQLTDPDGNSLILTFSTNNPAEQKLYGEYICELLNRIDHIMWNVDWRTQQVAGLFRELKHRIEKTNQAYIRGIEDAADVVSSVQAVSPTSRDALNEAINRLEQLRNHAKEVKDEQVSSRFVTEHFQEPSGV